MRPYLPSGAHVAARPRRRHAWRGRAQVRAPSGSTPSQLARMQQTTHRMRRATCDAQVATCNIRDTECNMQHGSHNMQRTTCAQVWQRQRRTCASARRCVTRRIIARSGAHPRLLRRNVPMVRAFTCAEECDSFARVAFVWACVYPSHVCTETGLTPPPAAQRLNSPLPHLYRD